MKTNPLIKLASFGQSIWLDYIKRDLISSGALKQLITADGLRGITSNPSIFEKAIAESSDYDKDIEHLTAEGKNADAIYNILTQRDVSAAADEFLPLYNQSNGKFGYVSLELNPHLAHDTDGAIAEGRQLWQALNRPNVLIKVPGTRAGLPAITQLISEGINVNVTLLFGVPRYQEVANAYLAGLEQRAAQGKSVDHIASVASFFISRIDALVDPLLEKIGVKNDEKSSLAKKLQGQVAIASAQIAYEVYTTLIDSTRFKNLTAKGAQPQQLLWASTSTKNPNYSDVKYVEALVGANTVNTMPMETLNSYRDHGAPALQLAESIEQAHWVFQQLPQLGIDIDKLTQQLEDEGVDKFNTSFDQLMAAIKKKMAQ